MPGCGERDATRELVVAFLPHCPVLSCDGGRYFTVDKVSRPLGLVAVDHVDFLIVFEKIPPCLCVREGLFEPENTLPGGDGISYEVLLFVVCSVCVFCERHTCTVVISGVSRIV